jgi:drug/metabolite transporter (DMT)-like permease
VSRIDALLVLMVVIWGVNYSVIKRAFEEIPPQPFNALRLILASTVFYAGIRIARRRARRGDPGVPRIFYTDHQLTRRDQWALAWLGVVGHCAYQFCFVGGVNLTSVSHAALIIGATPVVIALVSALLGRERLSQWHWIGAAISAIGIYYVVGYGAAGGGATVNGDLLVIASVGCWAAYTLGAGRLMARHSPLYVTGMTMLIGGVPYVIIASPQLILLDLARVSAWTWWALMLSALLALNVAYLIWYIAVQRIGPARTSMYSNLVPIVAMAVAWLWLGEPLTMAKIVGAATVLGGVAITRMGSAAMTRPGAAGSRR